VGLDRKGHPGHGMVVTPQPPGRRWFLLIHQLPPKPDYLRVKIWRRLQRMGAVAIKSSVYALPGSEPSAAEHFEWLLREIVERGGEGSICEATFVDGLSDAQIEALFRAARETDYAAVMEEIEGLVRESPARRTAEQGSRSELAAAAARLRRRFGEIAAIDFFGAPARQAAEAALARLDARIRPPKPSPKPSPARAGATKPMRNRIWVTRRGVYVDRIASAWLIRRFIDPRARFRFVDERGYEPRKGEVRFDMFDGEYTHEGDRCSFETLALRFGIHDPAVRAVGEVVHDIDLKDRKFGRAETAGFERLITGLARRHAGDEERIEAGAALLDSLYEAFRSETHPRGAGSDRRSRRLSLEGA